MNVFFQAVPGQALIVGSLFHESVDVIFGCMVKRFSGYSRVAVHIKMLPDTAYHGAGKEGIFHIYAVFPGGAAQDNVLALLYKVVANGADIGERAGNDLSDIFGDMQ